MLFYLTKTLVVDNNNPQKKNICTAIHNISMQVIDGCHLLRGDYEAIAFFRNIFKDTPDVGLLFDNIYQNFATMSVPSFLNFYVEVVIDNPTIKVVNGVTVGQRCYRHYLGMDVIGKTKLICEDLYDCKFFEHILQWYIGQEHLNVGYSFHSLNGGGDNTYRVVLNEVNAQHISICIVDTDKRYPNSKPKEDSTFSQCTNKVLTTDIEYKFLPLEVHEIENLVPLNYIDAFDIWNSGFPNDAVHKRAFDCLRSEGEAILPYFDYKKGIKKKDVLASKEYWSFAEKCYRTNAEKLAADPCFRTYVDKVSNGEIYPQLLGGTGTIKNTLKLIDSGKAPKPELLTFQRNNWNIIGKAMLDWCIARKSEALT